MGSAFVPLSTMPTGTVKKFVAEKGFGFITPDDGSEDVFVHRSINGQDREAYLEEGQAVTYEVEWDDMKGKWKASSCDGFKSGGGGGGGGGGWGGGGGKGGQRLVKMWEVLATTAFSESCASFADSSGSCQDLVDRYTSLLFDAWPQWDSPLPYRRSLVNVK